MTEQDYMGLVAQFPCLVCGSSPVCCHHPRYTGESCHMGTSQRASDYEVIPLCPSCHRLYHSAPKLFVCKYGYETDLVIKTRAQILEKLNKGELC